MTHNFERDTWVKEGFLAMVSGILYGATNVLVGHPLDTIKTKMQAQEKFIATPSFLNSLSTVWKGEGVRGLYRGALPPLIGSSIYRSTQFAVYESLYTFLAKYNNLTASIPFTHGLQTRVILSGIIAATARAIIENPIEYAKVRRQTGQEWIFSNIYTGFKYQLLRTGGLMTSYFIMIDYVRRETQLFHTKIGQFIASGTCATVAFWFVWPFEITKNQIQAGLKNWGDSVIEKETKLLKIHGKLKGYFRGLIPGSLSIFFRNGASMIVMQYAQKKFTEFGLRENKKQLVYLKKQRISFFRHKI